MNVKQDATIEDNPLSNNLMPFESVSSINEFSYSNQPPRLQTESPRFRTEPPRLQTQFIVITKEPGLTDFIPLIFSLIIYGLIIQTACTILKKINKRLYNRLVFTVLFLAPVLLFISAGNYVFPITWTSFSLVMGVLYIKINKKPLQKDMPRKTFNIFKTLFITTNLGILIYQTLTILSFFFFQASLISYFIFLLTFLYFGLLSREFVYFFSETMATNTGFYSKEGVPTRNNNDSICMICTKVFDNTELVHTLICNHSFHENCIKGWCIIAKKKRCPYCKKGVDLDSIPKDIWYKSEVWFYPLINTLRSFIIFTVAISAVIYYKISQNKI